MNTNKLFLLLISLSMLIALPSCSDDDDDISVNEIEGTWDSTKFSSEIQPIKGISETVLDEFKKSVDAALSDAQCKIKFQENGTFAMEGTLAELLGESSSITGTYELKGNRIHLKMQGSADPIKLIASRSGNTLTLKIDVLEDGASLYPMPTVPLFSKFMITITLLDKSWEYA